jgi:hypothetical protein
MAAKLIVTPTKGGSRITLVGTSGTELLSSKIFTEPRGKGATLRSLKGLLGDDIVIEDRTAGAARRAVASAKSVPSPVKTARIAATKPASRRRPSASK